MIIKLIYCFLILSFYCLYFAKAILLKKQGISSDRLGKGKKEKELKIFEIVLKIFTFISPIIFVLSVIFGNSNILCSTFAICFALISCFLFFMSAKQMSTNWRAGIDKSQNTCLVTNGIYKLSRNPAFLSFDILYLSSVLFWFSIPTVSISIVAVLLFHFQILFEEKYLSEKFKNEYTRYKEKTRRYFLKK